MLFSSLEFIYLFLPVTLLLYFLSPRKLKNFVLLTVSLFFYAFGEPIYVFLMLGVIVADYLFGIAIEKFYPHRRALLTLAVIFNLSLLIFFKYYDATASAFGLPTVGIALPIGISFYIFQSLSYVIDVYRRTVSAERNIVNFGAYVSLFPQLIAGPIVRYSDVSRELHERTHTIKNTSDGAVLFIIGLSKKVLLANGAGILADELLAENSVLPLWLGTVFFAFQIYYDFSGYSDMAIGLGRILGFDFPQNFNYPYTSASITDFWRRWHITLSSWFREYVYFPLGGNRKGRIRTYINLFVVWSLTGLWHGASVNFLMWGMWFFILLAIEKSFLLKALDKLPKWIGRIYALLGIMIGWRIFYMDGASFLEVCNAIPRLFGIGATAIFSPSFLYQLFRSLPFLVILCVGSTAIPKKIFAVIKAKYNFQAEYLLVPSLALLGIILCSAYITDGAYNPFLYFKF